MTANPPEEPPTEPTEVVEAPGDPPQLLDVTANPALVSSVGLEEQAHPRPTPRWSRRARPVGWRRSRDTDRDRSRRQDALAAQHESITIPIGIYDVWRIASKGYPLGEPYEAVIKRNQRITVAYSDLSRQLAELVAGDDGELDANWCTYAAWSSHTIGLHLARLTHRQGYSDVDPEPGDERTGVERVPFVRTVLGGVARNKAASLRAMAAGNRAVFLEIGLTVATFINHFRDRVAPDAEAGEQGEGPVGPGSPARYRELYGETRLEDCWEQEWKECWRSVEAQLHRFSELDLSWVLPSDHPPDALRRGLRHYLLAMRSKDPQERAEHVLTANILVAAYEQRRVDGYVWAGLALFTHRAMRRLVRERTGDVGGLRRLPSRLFARAITRGMKLHLGKQIVRLVQPVPSPRSPLPVASRNGNRSPDLLDDTTVSLPELQALIDVYQLSHRRPPHRGARNWTCYDERMCTIVDLFRRWQRQQPLFDVPFDAITASTILSQADDGHRPRRGTS